MTYETRIANIITRLKEVKEHNPDITLQKIADHTGVSLSTVTRIFDKDSENKSFRYDSIKPIAKMLLDLDSLDEGTDDEKSLKAIIQYKETAIAQLKEQLEMEREKHEKKLEKERTASRASIEFLKHQITLKDDRITQLMNALDDRNTQFKQIHEQYLAIAMRVLNEKSD